MGHWVAKLNAVTDIRDLDEGDVKMIGRAVHKSLVVVIPNQNNISQDDLVEFCETIGTVDKIPHDEDYDRHRRHTATYNWWNGVIRVTGELNRDNEPGLFPHKEELKWHIDQASTNNRNCFPALHGIRGTEGSVTGFLNNILSYNDLPSDIKDRIKDIEIFCWARHGTYSPKSYKFFRNHINNTNKFPLVHTNNGGETGLFFPFNQIFDWVTEQDDARELYEILKDHVLQEKYMYKHEWQDGDLVLLEQNLLLHKRYYFENITDRLLHRVSFDDSKL